MLDAFRPNLELYLEEHPDASFNDLCKAFGPPEEMAAILLLQASKQEKQADRLRRLLLRMATGILCATLLLFTVYVYFYKEFKISYHDVYYIYSLETVAD